MLWLPLTLLSAFTQATSDALAKRAFTRHNEYLILWLRIVIALPFLLAPLLFIPIPPIGREFYTATLFALPLEALAALLYIRALKLSPLSLTLPLLAFTPVFLLVVPHLLLGERLSAAGTLGILCVAFGSYLLNLGEFKNGLLAPFRAIGREPGARCMLTVALIFSITSTLGKQAITASSPLFFSAVYYPLLLLLLTPVVLRKAGSDLREISTNGTFRAALAPGLSDSVMILSHMVAVSLAPVAYMIAVKRSSLLMGVLYGHFLFREPGVRHRLPGAALMLAGVALIATGA